jgi:Sulfotransferase family
MPRSGTSWLSQIIDSSPEVRFRLSPLFSYEFKNQLNEASSRDEWLHVFQGAYNSDNEFMDQTYRRKAGEYPVFEEKDKEPEYLAIKDTRFHNLTERMLILFDNLKMIAIVRNPCGAIHSWLTSHGEFPSEASPLKEWRTGACRKKGYGEFWGFDDWKLVTKMHLRLAGKLPEKFLIQRYEKLVDDPLGETKGMFDFLGLEYKKQTDLFLRQCHSTHVANEYAVFKNPCVKDRWHKELRPEIRETIIEELKGTELEVFIK